jgi:hypothetical protein
MSNWIRKWIAFFRPLPGWKARFLDFKRGRTSWKVPGRPECRQVVPWPVAWIPHRPLAVGEGKDEAEEKTGFAFLDAVCVDSGKAAAVGVGVRCCRCGVDLHPIASGQFSAFDPARCRRCRWVLGFLR